jgi:hypothetical protein
MLGLLFLTSRMFRKSAPKRPQGPTLSLETLKS